jgi:2-amino-4-ketopentanoate thiolase beta subunit
MKGFFDVLERKQAIMKASVGIDYATYEQGTIAFDYERMMADCPYSLTEIAAIQAAHGTGNTPLKELKRIGALARSISRPGYGARIFVKDEAQNDSGSFKARRAAIAVHHAKKMGYKGVIAATSGNYGAAVASQAAKHGLACIIVQECYDHEGVGQPEIIEKARACEAYGAEVVQLSVGPELFSVFLQLLEETGYFNASLYSPYGIAGIETIGAELIADCLKQTGKTPDAVVVTHAGGGNVTGTARGIRKTTDAPVTIIGASVSLKGLHMASDADFNRKSFTTGHTGFGIPFLVNPDRSDVPRSAARALRYLDRYVTVTQGSTFFVTEMLACLEGIERGPAGNTALAAAFAIAQTMKEEQILIVQETEYTGAGKHHQAQLTFARNHGIDIRFGNPCDEVPGTSIVLPNDIRMIQTTEVDLDRERFQRIKTAVGANRSIQSIDVDYLSDETNWPKRRVQDALQTLGIHVED